MEDDEGMALADMDNLKAEASSPPPPFITLTQTEQGGWTLDTNLQPGQAKWTICEVAATLLAELKPKG